MNIRKLTSLGIVFFAGVFQSWADDPSTADNPDSIFNDPSVLTNPEPATIKTKQQDDFLQSSETRIGGKFIGSFVTSWDWNQGTPPGWQFPDASAFTPDVESDIWFDSRPQKDFRVFGKGALIYPFQGDQTSNYPMTGATSSNSPNVYVKELFADFPIGPVSIRAGKQNIKTGVGYYFSPADVFSLDSINPLSPELDLNGPLAVKAQLSTGTTNWYLYSDMNNAENPQEIAWIPRIEWVWGLAEIGLEGYWEQGKTTKAINTISDSYGDFSLYSELVASYGSDKSLVSRDTNSNAGLQVGENTTTWYFSGTWGFKYDNTQYNIVVMAQYYYNGEGYADDSLLGTAESLVIASSPQLTSSDLSYWGIHNFALGWNFSKLDNSDLGVSGLWLIDGSDGSGIFYPRIYYQYGSYLYVSLGPSFTYGNNVSYYAQFGNKLSFKLEIDLGGGGELGGGLF